MDLKFAKSYKSQPGSHGGAGSRQLVDYCSLVYIYLYIHGTVCLFLLLKSFYFLFFTFFSPPLPTPSPHSFFNKFSYVRCENSLDFFRLSLIFFVFKVPTLDRVVIHYKS
jgi:hypothetical protein